MFNSKIVLLSISTLLVVILTTFIRFYDVRLDSIIMFIAFGIMGFCVSVYYFSPLKTSIIISSSLFIIYTLSWTCDNLMIVDPNWNYLQIGTFSFVFGILGAISGSLLANKKIAIWIRLIWTLFFLVLNIWFYISLYNYWSHYIGYNNLDGRVSEHLPNDWYLIKEENDTISANNFKSKTVLLDFWTVSCINCFQEFPVLNSIYEQYRNRKDFILFAVNIPIKNFSSVAGLDKIKQSGYSFPTIIGNELVREAFLIDKYPTVIIIQKNKIVFRGNIYMAQNYLKELL